MRAHELVLGRQAIARPEAALLDEALEPRPDVGMQVDLADGLEHLNASVSSTVAPRPFTCRPRTP
jgi:hypothetical protein